MPETLEFVLRTGSAVSSGFVAVLLGIVVENWAAKKYEIQTEHFRYLLGAGIACIGFVWHIPVGIGALLVFAWLCLNFCARLTDDNYLHSQVRRKELGLQIENETHEEWRERIRNDIPNDQPRLS